MLQPLHVTVFPSALDESLTNSIDLLQFQLEGIHLLLLELLGMERMWERKGDLQAVSCSSSPSVIPWIQEAFLSREGAVATRYWFYWNCASLSKLLPRLDPVTRMSQESAGVEHNSGSIHTHLCF